MTTFEFCDIFDKNAVTVKRSMLGPQEISPPRNFPARTAEDRYSRDLRRHELAVRFIHHGARTGTVRCWTGLSDSSVLRIRHACGESIRERTVTGRRGPAPRRVTRYLLSRRNRIDSAAFIGLCHLMGLIPARPMAKAMRTYPSIARGEQVCTAFERFRTVVPDGEVTLDQLARLLLSVVEGGAVTLTRCAGCGTIWLLDLTGETSRRCVLCEELGKLARLSPPTSTNGSPSAFLSDPESLQGRLFP